MDRLTIRNADGSVSVTQNADGRKINARLCEYEETGLTPEEMSKFADTLFDARVQIIPCKIGDVVWGIRKLSKGTKKVKQGTVIGMYYGEAMQLGISVKGVCIGLWGKNIFATKEEADAAYEAMMKEASTV